MATTTTRSRRHAPPLSGVTTVGDLLRRLGNVPARRVRMVPTPGTATEKDLLLILDRDNIPCELVEGTLVEKAMGYEEAEIALLIGTLLNNFVRPRKLGIVAGSDGTLRLFHGLVRIPDVSYISWASMPGGKRPRVPIPSLAPDLAVEVLSKGNTKAEMNRKLGEYFAAGVRLVWLVDARKRTVRVYTSVDRFTTLSQDEDLDGGEALPGFRVPVAGLFPQDGR
jgi:Uma2 family endonuclease